MLAQIGATRYSREAMALGRVKREISGIPGPTHCARSWKSGGPMQYNSLVHKRHLQDY